MSKDKPSEQRRQQREEEKLEGRSRRADFLLNEKAKEKARHDVLESRVGEIDERITDLEKRVAALEATAKPSEPKPAADKPG
jgi:chromosome segregation ATPase